MPLILLAAECNHVDCSSEVLRCTPVLKDDLCYMRIQLVFVDQHQSPLTIRPKKSIRGHQNVADGITNVASRRKHFVPSIPRLCPLLGDQLTSEVLRRVLFDLIVRVHSEHAKCAHGAATAAVEARWQIMKVVKPISACSEERTGKIREPQSAESIDERLSSVPRDV